MARLGAVVTFSDVGAPLWGRECGMKEGTYRGNGVRVKLNLLWKYITKQTFVWYGLHSCAESWARGYKEDGTHKGIAMFLA
jgi:hypothetical protein